MGRVVPTDCASLPSRRGRCRGRGRSRSNGISHATKSRLRASERAATRTICLQAQSSLNRSKSCGRGTASGNRVRASIMTGPYERLVSNQDLPDSLWSSSDRHLIIPPTLVRAYAKAIVAHNLESLSQKGGAGSGPVGGLTKEASDQHFAQSFSGSVARMQLAALDPDCRAEHVADAFVKMLAGGKVLIIDVPSGSGAASLALLCTICELRAKSILPRIPLDVVLIGGEISPHARAYSQYLLAEVRGDLCDQAINVESRFVHWDACDRASTTLLIKQVVRSIEGCAGALMVVANFNGFLHQSGKQKEVRPQLEDLFRYAASSNTTAIWIEPQNNGAVAQGGLFPWLRKLFKDTFLQKLVEMIPSGSTDDFVTMTTSRFRHPIRTTDVYDVRLAVVRFSLREEP